MKRELGTNDWRMIDETIVSLQHKSEEDATKIITGYGQAVSDLFGTSAANAVVGRMLDELGIVLVTA